MHLLACVFVVQNDEKLHIVGLLLGIKRWPPPFASITTISRCGELHTWTAVPSYTCQISNTDGNGDANVLQSVASRANRFQMCMLRFSVVWRLHCAPSPSNDRNDHHLVKLPPILQLQVPDAATSMSGVRFCSDQRSSSPSATAMQECQCQYRKKQKNRLQTVQNTTSCSALPQCVLTLKAPQVSPTKLPYTAC